MPPQVYVPPPRSPEAPAALEALSRVPGPSPWYLERRGTEIHTVNGALRWASAGSNAQAAGKSILQTVAGSAMAVTDFGCYVNAIASHRLLVWYVEEAGKDATLQQAMRFRVFDADELRPIHDLTAAFKQLGSRSRFHAESGELASIALSTALDDGDHTVTIPDAFREAGELLVVAPSTAGGRRESGYETHLRLWILDLARGHLQIIPQDWFNNGAYDSGYQWVARFARLRLAGDIVGEAIRLGVFRLDQSHRQIAEWLIEDLFFQPDPATAYD